MIQRLERVDTNVLGMVLFILNEIVFFALLIIAFIDYEATRFSHPGPEESLHPNTALIYTFFLLASSGTMFFTDRAMERRNNTGVIIGLIATVLLGGVFLVGQGIEYVDLLVNHITPSTNLFGTTFFSLTGFHGLHVTIGLIMLSILAFLAIRGDFKSGRSGALSAVSLYWHFVDVVWIVIFSIIYLWAAGGLKF